MATFTSLAGKVAIVTGAAGGLGGATVRRLANEDAHVVAIDLDVAAVQKVLDGLPGEHLALSADVSTEGGVDDYVSAAVERFGRIDLHHLNAGISGSLAQLPDLTIEDFDKVIAVNLRGVFLGLRAAMRQYRAQNSGGAIVLTASIGSLRGSSDLLPYQTSKHGVLGLLRGGALYGGPLGIRVNAVAPGIVPTELFASQGNKPGGSGDMAHRASTTPLRRAGTGDEIANVVAFLLSDEASYMTGEVVSVDGGAAAVSIVRLSGGAGAWDTEAFDQSVYGERNSQ